LNSKRDYTAGAFSSGSHASMPIEFENPARYQELLETLAGQVHLDLLRQYPDELWQARTQLLSFEQLTDQQKDLERIAAKENLESLLGAGVRIEPPRTPESGLLEMRFRVEALLKQGEPILAYDLVRRALGDYPGDVSLRQLQALALIRTGAPGEASLMLSQLLAENHRGQGTLAPLARAYRDFGERTSRPEVRRQYFTQALELYEEAYRVNHGVWSGIHAAWLALELGDPEAAVALAAAVEMDALRLIETAKSGGSDTFWLLAILGIVSVLQRRFREGFDCFENLADIGRGRSGDLAEVRHVARSILVLLREDPSTLELVLPSPRVLVFAGHMVDFPDRKTPRFPPELTEILARVIRGRVSSLRAEAGFATAACGAPILFHEAIAAQEGESHVLLPYGRDEFRADSVAIREDMDWSTRYDKVLDTAHRVILGSPQRLDEGSVVFYYSNLLLLGLAKLRARQLRCDLKALVVWDGQPSAAAGSVAKTVELWKKLGYPPEVIDLRTIQEGIPDIRQETRPARSGAANPAGLSTKVMVMLFADVVHFSLLQERQVPRFVEHFLGTIGRLEKTTGVRPIMKNTWGDGLFLVFRQAADAIRYGRALVDAVNRTDWGALGLPADLNLRVALHAGPVYLGKDPVTGRRTCFGTHVNNAARIEPITPPGKIYVSQAFAALATALDLKDCPCEYVGQMPLAKNFGTFPMYVLQAAEDPAEG